MGDAEAFGRPSRIEGIGRPTVSPSFMPAVIDRMIPVADARSIATLICGGGERYADTYHDATWPAANYLWPDARASEWAGL